MWRCMCRCMQCICTHLGDPLWPPAHVVRAHHVVLERLQPPARPFAQLDAGAVAEAHDQDAGEREHEPQQRDERTDGDGIARCGRLGGVGRLGATEGFGYEPQALLGD